MKKQNWKIVYTEYAGMEKKAVELLSAEIGALTLRDTGIYTIHVLACEQVEQAILDTNTVLIGLHRQNPVIQKYIDALAIPQNGYVVKAIDNPDSPEHKLVLITAHEPTALFYGAVDFVDDCLAESTPADHHPIRLVDEVLSHPMPDYYSASAPVTKTRTVFTWGHPINDYRNYIENMARLRLNEWIIWNDYVPLNAKDLVEYAHEFDIRVIWGFAWGWSRDCAGIDLSRLEQMKEEILNTYEQQYKNIAGDGIYFQSFTETQLDSINGRPIADTVVEFVNTVSAALLERYPSLRIQFGLHADSVKNHLDSIRNVDKRVKIVWENCGTFPYGALGAEPFTFSESEFEQTRRFSETILSLRQGETGMLFKGFMTLDWCGDRFVHQAGPFVLGKSNRRLIEHDRTMLEPIWRYLQTGWMKNGAYAHRMTRLLTQHDPNITIGMAGQFAGGIWFAEALCAQLLWECNKPYDEIFDKVAKRRCVDIV